MQQKYGIGWIQALTGLPSHEWAETKDAYLKSIGEKITGQRWVSSLIRKLCGVAWDMCNYIKNTLHALDGPTQAAVLAHTNEGISYHFNRGTIGLATRCYFLLKTKEHNLLYRPIRHKIVWLAAITSAQRCTQPPNKRRNTYLITDYIFLNSITKNHLIPTLRK